LNQLKIPINPPFFHGESSLLTSLDPHFFHVFPMENSARSGRARWCNGLEAAPAGLAAGSRDTAAAAGGASRCPGLEKKILVEFTFYFYFFFAYFFLNYMGLVDLS
jgi:hypothetical protein